MARILSIDYGLKRVGIAVTDPAQIIATGLTTIHAKDVISYLKEYTAKEQVECFVIGKPKRMDNTDTHATAPTEAFVNILRKQFADIPIHRVDERFTSKMASQAILASGIKKKARQDKGLVDMVSATIILQLFLERRDIQREL